MPPPCSSAYATAATAMEPSASPTKKNEAISTSIPEDRRAPSQCASRGALRHCREGGEATTESAPSTPITLITSSAHRSDQSATHVVTSNGPTAKSTSCATASSAYAAWTRSARLSTPGHSARSPPSSGGVKNPAITMAAYATGSGSRPTTVSYTHL